MWYSLRGRCVPDRLRRVRWMESPGRAVTTRPGSTSRAGRIRRGDDRVPVRLRRWGQPGIFLYNGNGYGASGIGWAAREGDERDHPFNRPYATGAEFGYIREAIANSHLSGNGPFAARCTALLEQETGSGKGPCSRTRVRARSRWRRCWPTSAGRRGDRAFVRFLVHRERVRAARRDAGLRRHPARHAQPERAAGR